MTEKIITVVMDTETTGLLPTDQICSLAWLGLGSLPNLSILQTFNELFDIEGAMPASAFNIHKIPKTDLKGKPKFQNISQVGLPETVQYIVFHNAAYDWDKMLKKPLKDVKVICTMKLAKKLMPKEDGCSMSPSGKFRSYKLVDLCSDIYPEKRDFIFSGAHGSSHDARLTILLINHFIANWEIKTWEELYELQEV